MNERIWQLQGQARVLAEQHIAHRKFDDYMEYQQVLYDTTMNKFAELIVRECGKVIRFGGQRKGAFGHEDLRPSEIATMIEEHFGVEE